MSVETQGTKTDRAAPKPAPWNDPRIRAIFYQVVVIGGVVLFAAYLVNNTLTNLEERNIRTGFGFLEHEAGFGIGEHIINYAPSDSYFRAFLVGITNTLRVAFIGIILCTILGTIIGIARLSQNWLIRKLASVYVETVRNIPLLLQLFAWYTVIGEMLPIARDAVAVGPSIYLSKSGLQFPAPLDALGFDLAMYGFLLAILAAWFYRRWTKKVQERTGLQKPLFLPVVALLIGFSVIGWLIGGAPTAFDVPELGKFRIEGGTRVTPEFLALLLGLTIYTSGFVAEIVRSGILAISGGQTEAGLAIGLRRGLVMRLIVLPQALRVIVPPTTSQYLNLTKNSSLAVAIGYPDLVSIGNTTLNQTGQAIEAISIYMLVYLTISLSISGFMNWYNKHIALVER